MANTQKTSINEDQTKSTMRYVPTKWLDADYRFRIKYTEHFPKKVIVCIVNNLWKTIECNDKLTLKEYNKFINCFYDSYFKPYEMSVPDFYNNPELCMKWWCMLFTACVEYKVVDDGKYVKLKPRYNFTDEYPYVIATKLKGYEALIYDGDEKEDEEIIWAREMFVKSWVNQYNTYSIYFETKFGLTPDEAKKYTFDDWVEFEDSHKKEIDLKNTKSNEELNNMQVVSEKIDIDVKKKIAKIDCATNETVAIYSSRKDAMLDNDISKQALSHCISGRRKQVKGYIYKEI